MIKYLGSKRLLLPHILAAVGAFPDVRRVLDPFSGTARVGRALREAGYEVVASDLLRYASTLARCYVAADPEVVTAPAQRILDELAALPPSPGYVTQVFCEEARFFHPKNGARIDAMRARIRELALEPTLEAVVLTSLLEAADRVDSTTGVQMAYLKAYARRAHNELTLRMPALVPGRGEALEGDAREVVGAVEADLLYLDPPYNQHSYLGNYHVWETLARGDTPETYGVAKKRVDCRERRSDFNSRVRIAEALAEVITSARARHLVVSFSDEGFLDRATLEAMLAPRGHVGVARVRYARYVGAKIGIHDPSGRRVGKVSHTKNHELLFVVSPDRASVERAIAAVEALGSPVSESSQVPLPLG
ncbi:MAG: DNA adenine methylase [Myxococcales bacterium]|nr:DNA adenine methylase [Myxococcales bacterium]